jgi:DNA-directed RNA polymerase subunit RPC12/RpoP
MAQAPAKEDVTCVHCRKAFRAEILGSGTEQAGVKCPHCRLFMPLERTEVPDAPAVDAA